MPRLLFLTFVTAAVLTSSGCQCCHRPVATRATVVPGGACPTNTCPPPGGVALPPPPSPLGGAPGGFVPGPGTPPPSITIPPAPSPYAPGVKVVPPGSASLTPPRFELNWQPAEARNQPSQIAQAIPDPLLGPSSTTPSPSSPKLYPPEVLEKSTGEPPLIDEKSNPGALPPSTDNKPKTAFPAGIPQFAKAVENVWGGLRPSIDDGLDWLAAKEYRTVLHLRAPGEPESADRKQVERLGMTYISLEVSPQSLSRDKFDDFVKVVGDVARRPLFVYDQDGSIAGPLWYLYFRKVGANDDQPARVRANTLGLRADPQGQHLLMWLAVQKYLEENP
jgi:protein tyrosine phosphatase (PTP) superfamily phosphohydrolase (DUF442 family)